MKGKKEKFYEILKKYGIKYYWSTKYFDPEKDYPKGEIVIPKDDVDLSCEINNLYNDKEYLSEDDMLLILTMSVNEENILYFKNYVKKLVKHEVY